MSIDIGPVRFGDHDQLREVRLRALGEDPEAFASWLEEERAHPRSWWEELVAVPGHPDVLEERYERPEPPNPQLSRGSGGKSA